MSRRKKNLEAAAQHTPAPAESEAEAAPELRRPVARWKFPTMDWVNVEVCLWPQIVVLQNGESAELLQATITRSYKDQEGRWQKGGSFRISELPVLIHALTRAHAFGLDSVEMPLPS